MDSACTNLSAMPEPERFLTLGWVFEILGLTTAIASGSKYSSLSPE
jgi:hypothetical protein